MLIFSKKLKFGLGKLRGPPETRGKTRWPAALLLRPTALHNGDCGLFLYTRFNFPVFSTDGDRTARISSHSCRLRSAVSWSSARVWISDLKLWLSHLHLPLVRITPTAGTGLRILCLYCVLSISMPLLRAGHAFTQEWKTDTPQTEGETSSRTSPPGQGPGQDILSGGWLVCLSTWLVWAGHQHSCTVAGKPWHTSDK